MSWWNCFAGALLRLFSRLLVPLALLALWSACTASAQAWGIQGHQVVASMAWQGLSPAARDQAARLLALEPGQTLASVATWADEHRNPNTAPWHYLNFPRGVCQFDAARDCPEGQCVVAAIGRQAAVLASSVSDAERLKALKYLVHFVADVHQPLHAGYGDDRGGNTVQLRFFMQSSNLHALWDRGLLDRMNMDNAALAAAALAQPATPDAGSSTGELAIVMAEESCRIVAQPGFYPQGDPSEAYVARMTPVVLRRLALAASRLAAILNQALP